MPFSPLAPRRFRRFTELYALAAALLLFLAVFLFLASCGTDDLVFPGNIPATATPVNTATPVPEGN